jgi:hypothetical protein
VKSPLFVRDRALLVSGVVKTVLDAFDLARTQTPRASRYV